MTTWLRRTPDAKGNATSELMRSLAPPPPPRVASKAATATNAPPTLARIDDRVLLPDLRGLTVAEVKRITAEGALVVEVSGSGRAIDQDPPPGTVLPARGGRVRVQFARQDRGSGEDEG